MKDFKQFLKEHAIIDKELEYFNTIKNTATKKTILKTITIEIEKLKEEFINMKWEDIYFQEINRYHKKISYLVYWNYKISLIQIKIRDMILKFKDDEELYDRLEKILNVRDNLEIDIDGTNFNRIHLPIDLPKYLRNIGIGKKIYRAAINNFGYVSTMIQGSDKASLDAKMIWDNIIHSDDVYSVIKDDIGIISFSKKLDFIKIEKILKEYLKDSDKYALDKEMKG